MPEKATIDCITTPRWKTVPIPFTNKELVISRIEWIGYIAILHRYDYILTIVERKPK